MHVNIGKTSVLKFLICRFHFVFQQPTRKIWRPSLVVQGNGLDTKYVLIQTPLILTFMFSCLPLEALIFRPASHHKCLLLLSIFGKTGLSQ